MDDHGLQPGSILKERYRIEKVLGEGAYGTVYRASDLTMEGTLWAVKEIREGALPPGERQEAVAHFFREAGILRSLNHTGVPKVIDLFTSCSCHYMVMEHVEGRTLQELIRSERPDVQTVVRWALKLCQILACLHETTPHPLIFRDLKPANIMITPRGRLLLVDFGIARYLDPAKTADTVALGTPGYAAPEQYGTARTDCRSDIYSLGAILFELLTGADVASFQFRFPPAAELNPAVGPVLEGVIMRCLERLPEKRYQGARDLREALLPLYKKKHGTVTASSPVGPKASLAGISAQKPVSLAPLPPSARLWSPRRRPIRLPFLPESLNDRIEALADPACIASGYLLMPVLFTDLMTSHLLKAGYVHPGIHGSFESAVISTMTWALGIIVLHRLVTRKIWIGFLLFMFLYSLYFTWPYMRLLS
jgi:serine/threonine protein kinase